VRKLVTINNTEGKTPDNSKEKSMTNSLFTYKIVRYLSVIPSDAITEQDLD
jgi:hypothetical protein